MRFRLLRTKLPEEFNGPPTEDDMVRPDLARRVAGSVQVASTKPIISQHQNRTREELAYKRSSSSFSSSHVHCRVFSTRRTDFPHLRLLAVFIPSVPSFSQVFAFFFRLRRGDFPFSSPCVPTSCSPRFIGLRHVDGDATGVAVHTLASKYVCAEMTVSILSVNS